MTALGVSSRLALWLSLRFALRLTLRFALRLTVGSRSYPRMPDRAWLRGGPPSLTCIPTRGSTA